MPNLGSLWYTMGIRDMTDADLRKINDKLAKAGSDLLINPHLARSVNDLLPKGIKLELDPQLKQVSDKALARAVEGKVMKVEIVPLITNLRRALKEATAAAPPEIEVGIQAAKLRSLIERVLNRQGFTINISTVNDNYTRTVQAQLNGRTYRVKIHADAAEITQSVQASLMQVQSRSFGLVVSRDTLRNSIDQALMGKPFNIQIAVMHDQARRAVQNALNNARMVGKDDALAFQRMQTGELRAAQAELARLRAAHMGAAGAAGAHASASINLGGAMGSNIKIAGELGAAMASLYSVHAAREFLSQVIEIGGELEHQKIAMDTIFGDKGKTNELFGQIKGLARQSPFGVMELTKSVKALSAYGVQYNEIYDTAKRLADISAATSVDINRLILAFGKTKSRGFLDGLEAKQFAYANIPIYEMVRQKLEQLEGQAVTTADVMARMKKREIGFDIVKDVLWDMTDEGGKFYNMQEALAGSVKTSWKLVRDNIELMFGEIAEGAVGEGLKSIAQVLQKLTQNWRTVAAVVGTAAVGLGVYKIATLGVNSAVQKGTIATYNNIIAQKRKAAEELKTWGRITKLTRAELMRVATANKLTNADLRQAITEGVLTDKHIAQLFWQKKVTAEQIKYLVNIGQLNPAMAKAILSNNRFSLSLQMMGNALQKAGAAMKAFLFNPWTLAIAAASAIASLWQRNSEENDRANEFGENFRTAGEGAAKSIGEALKKSTDVSGTGAERLLEEYKQLIKDYASTPDQIIEDAIFDENGKIRETADQIKYLREQLEQLKQTADQMENGHAENVVKATNGGWFDDDVVTDMKDWHKASSEADAAYLKFISQNKEVAKAMVEAAAQADSGYAETIKGMDSLYEKFSTLMKRREEFAAAYEAANEKGEGKLDDYTGKWVFDVLDYSLVLKGMGATDALSNIRKLLWGSISEKAEKNEASVEEVKKEILEAAEAFKVETEGWDYGNLEAWQEEYIRKFWNGLIEQAGIAAPEAKAEMQKMVSDVMGVDIQGLNGQSMIVDELKRADAGYLSKELAERLAKGLEITPEEQKQVDDAIKKAYKALFENAKENGDEWTLKALNAATGSNGHFEKGKFLKIQAKLDLTADWEEWKREINRALDGDNTARVWIQGSSDVLSFVKSAQEGYAAAQKTIDGLKPLMMKAGIGFQPGKKISMLSLDYANASPAARKMIDDYNKAIEAIDAATKAGDEYGFDPAAEYNKKNKGGSQKDPVAEKLRLRFKDIKDAWAMFKKWAKLEGKDAAFKRIGESGLFTSLSSDMIPGTVEEYLALVDGIEAELEAAGVKGNARESLFNDLVKERLGIKEDTIKEQLEKAKKEVSEKIKDITAGWNLYKDLFQATGDKEWATQAAFSTDKTYLDDAARDLVSELNERMTRKGVKLEVPFTLSEQDAREAFGGANEELFDLWKAVKDRIESSSTDALKAEAAAMQEFLKEYGTFQERRLAMEREYAEKIAEARAKGNTAQADLLERQRDSAGKKLEIEAIRQSVDWGSVFGNFGTMFREQLAPTLQKLRAIAGSEEFHNPTLQEQKVLYDLIDKLEKANTVWDGKIFKTLGNDLIAYQKAMRGYMDAQEKEKTAAENLTKAEEDLKRARQKGDPGTIKTAEGEVDKAKKTLKTASDDVRAFSGQVQDATSNLRTSSTDAANMFKSLASGIQSLTSGTLQGVGEGLMKLDALFSNGKVTGAVGAAMAKGFTRLFGRSGLGDAIAQALGNSGMLGQIISAILSLLDVLKKGLGYLISSLIDTILGAVAGIIKNLLNGKSFIQIGESLKDGIGGILDAVTWGGFTHWLDTGNAKDVKKTIDRLTDRNELLTKSIDDLRDTIQGYSSTRAITDTYKAIDLQKENNKNLLDMAKAQAGYHGSHHSWEYYWNGYTPEQISGFGRQIGRSWDGDIWSLSPEEMKMLRGNVNMWEQIVKTGKGGYGKKVAKYLSDYADQAEAIDELTDQLYETLTGMTFDSMYDDFLNTLMDMDASAEDFAYKISEYFFKAMLSKGIGDAFGEQLEGWYAKFGAAVENKSINDPKVREALMNEYMTYVDGAVKLRDELAQATGHTGEGGSKSGMTASIQGATEDTADLLASYINAVRSDVSVQTHELWPRLLDTALPQISVIAQSQLDAQRQIAENTLRNALAAEAIVKSNDAISDLLVRATQGSARFYIH